MIERYTITASSSAIADRYAVDVPDFYAAHYNAAPTQLLPVITSDNPDGISTFYWGNTPEWAKNKTLSEKVINSKAEIIHEKPALKRAMMSTRCIIPADGFYGWKKIGKKTQVPYRFVFPQKEIFSIAGIWEEFENENGESIHTFMMLTIPSNEFACVVQERMPLILDAENEKIWLAKTSSESALLPLIKSPTVVLNCYTVSPRINERNLDVPSLIIPTPAADQFGNLTLFD